MSKDWFFKMPVYAYHYQDKLYEWLRIIQPDIMVETGVGIMHSTKFILNALLHNGKGMLYSIEPCKDDVRNIRDVAQGHPHWAGVSQAKSKDVLQSIYEFTGPWDVFLHDSDHKYENQLWELEFAYEHVKPGGYILSDDVKNQSHNAWGEFIERHKDLAPTKWLGLCAVTRKPL